MRRVLYRVASSLDGYIEGPRGEIDWIVQDPTMNLATLYAGIDTALLGRRTYELTQRPGGTPFLGGRRCSDPTQTNALGNTPERHRAPALRYSTRLTSPPLIRGLGNLSGCIA
jgi:dihydrofolate reductase